MSFSITSFSNEKIKFVNSLKEKKNRDRSNLFFIEGYREIIKAIQSNKLSFHSLYFCRECFLGQNEDRILNFFVERNIKIYEIPKKIFEKMSYRDRPDGLVSVANTPDFKLKYENLIGNFFGIIEGVEKPGNLGTILRTAEGAGVDAIIVVDPRIDIFNPNVIRASTGTIFTLPLFITDRDTALDFLMQRRIKIFAVTPEAHIPYFQENYSDAVAFYFGSEQYGISDLAKNKINDKISIPMNGKADSLNLAMSAGILFYEVVRQRFKQ